MKFYDSDFEVLVCAICKQRVHREDFGSPPEKRIVYHDSAPFGGVVHERHHGVREWYEDLLEKAGAYIDDQDKIDPKSWTPMMDAIDKLTEVEEDDGEAVEPIL